MNKKEEFIYLFGWLYKLKDEENQKFLKINKRRIK